MNDSPNSASGDGASDSSPQVDFSGGFPQNAVVGIVRDPRELSQVVTEVRETGARPDVLCGGSGIERIEQVGGMSTDEVREVRSIQSVFGFEADHSARHQKAIDSGEFVVIVAAEEDDEADRIGEIMSSHGGRFINHYTRWTGRSLAP